MNIAIIGAGLSGLTAARQLQALGHQVIVFEKSRGRGGRLCSKRMFWEDKRTSLDIGAQYFTARDPRFMKVTQAWLDAGVIAPWAFDPHVFRDGVLNRSSDDQVRYVGVPTMNSLSHHLSEGLTIRRETRITRVEKTSDEWLLFDERGYCYQHFDWLFVSAPARQSFDLIDGISPLAESIPWTVSDPVGLWRWNFNSAPLQRFRVFSVTTRCAGLPSCPVGPRDRLIKSSGCCILMPTGQRGRVRLLPIICLRLGEIGCSRYSIKLWSWRITTPITGLTRV